MSAWAGVGALLLLALIAYRTERILDYVQAINSKLDKHLDDGDDEPPEGL